MPRKKLPATLKRGNTETKAQLAKRAALEKQLMGSSSEVGFAPEHLTEEEKIYYRWLVKEIEIAGIITNLDIPLLEQVANCLYIMRECDDIIREKGIIVSKVDRYGNLEDKENPAIKVKLSYQTKYATLCNQLGLSPAARSDLAGKQIEAEANSNDVLLKVLQGGDI